MKSFINLRFSKLLVIADADPIIDKDNKKRTAYLCKCDCGKEVIIKRHFLQNKKSGPKSCGCLTNEQRSKLGLSKRKLPPDLTSAKVFYNRTYSDGDITFEKFCELSQNNCYYCNSKPSNSYNKYINRDKWSKNSDFAKENGTFIYNGLDRIDSTLPHNENNVVPCCIQCNRAKSNKTSDYFKSWIVDVYNNWASK